MFRSLCCKTPNRNSDATGIIYRANSDGTAASAYVTSLGVPNGVAVDFPGEMLYFTDLTYGSIHRTSVAGGGDSGEIEQIVSGMAKPFRLSISWKGSRDNGPHLYWTDPAQGRLYRSDLNGTSIIVMGMCARWVLMTLNDGPSSSLPSSSIIKLLGSVAGVFGISGVVATYDYVYYTMPSEDAIYRVDFTCADLNGCDPEQVLIGVCDRPVDLNYSPITKLV